MICQSFSKQIHSQIQLQIIVQKCSEKQKYGAERVTHFLIDNKPDQWEELEKIYDPSGNYRMEYLSNKAIMAEGIDTETENNEQKEDNNNSEKR